MTYSFMYKVSGKLKYSFCLFVCLLFSPLSLSILCSGWGACKTYQKEMNEDIVHQPNQHPEIFPRYLGSVEVGKQIGNHTKQNRHWQRDHCYHGHKLFFFTSCCRISHVSVLLKESQNESGNILIYEFTSRFCFMGKKTKRVLHCFVFLLGGIVIWEVTLAALGFGTHYQWKVSLRSNLWFTRRSMVLLVTSRVGLG